MARRSQFATDWNAQLMDFAYYTAVIALSCFISCIMMVVVRNNVTLPAEKRRLFLMLFAGVVAGSVLEWGAKMLDGQGGNASYAIMLIKALEFSIAPALAVFYATIFTKGKDEKHVRYANGMLLAHAALEFVLMPFGLVFYVDAGGVYRHGPLYIVYIVAYLLSAVYLLVETKRGMKRFQARNRYLPWTILAFAFTGVFVQMAMGNARVTWIALSVAGVLFYIFYCGIIQQTDSLTRMLNRYSYDSTMQLLSRPAVVVFFDTDDFKDVNDSRGHDVGDKVLAHIGRAIFDVYGKNGSCYRIGGDEFSAIVYATAKEVEGLNYDFDRRLDEVRLYMPYMPTVSVGYAEFDPATSDIEDVKRRADARMYEAKRARKVGRSKVRQV